MNTYPIIALIIKWGTAFSIATGTALGLIGVYFALAYDVWMLAVIGLGAGLVVGLLLKSYSEIVEILSDMLLPK